MPLGPAIENFLHPRNSELDWLSRGAVYVDAKIVIKSVAGAEISVSVGFEVLVSMISSLPDDKAMWELCYLLSEHASADVREAIAAKEFLNEATLIRLSEDPSARVKSSLIRSDSFREWADSETLIKICRSDSNLAREIASSIRSFTNADTDALVKELAAHPDPGVRMELASGWGVSKFSIKSLSKDRDPSVAAAASRTLENR